MSITIHYSGRFKRSASLPGMINELKDIAEVQAWDYHIFEREFPADSWGGSEFNQEIYGICVTPPKSEPLWMCFLSNGQLSAPFLLQLWGKSQDENEKPYLTSVFTKTQFAGVGTHKALIHLLRYINSKYFEEFDLVDESGYWESGDEELAEEKFSEMNELLDLLTSELEAIPRKTGESIEDFIIRITNKIHKDKK